MRRFLLFMTALTLMVWGVLGYLVVDHQVRANLPLPTLMVLPSLTPTATYTATASATATYTASASSTATATATPTSTFIPTTTPTLGERLIEIVAVMPGVVLSPTVMPLPDGMLVMAALPDPNEPLPDATHQPPPYTGWISYESDHPAVRYSTAWQPRLQSGASRGQYHRTEDSTSMVGMTFEGEGLRIRYVTARNMGVFEVVVDGTVIETVDAYSTELGFPGTRIYSLSRGAHTLVMRSAKQRNPASEGNALALDSVQVFRGSADLLIIPPAPQSVTPTEQPRPAAKIELIAAPPTVQPTATPNPPMELTISVVIAYDENGNRAVDPAEGVFSIPVRVVETSTNRVIAQGFTGSSGYAQIQLVTDTPIRVVVPYFGKVWDIPNSRRGGTVQFTHLLTPGNQPGLIP
jgi:hypothetical protein